MASLVPVVAGAGLSYLAGRGTNNAIEQSQASQNTALTKQGDLAKQMGTIAGARYNLSQPAYGRAMDYYTSLLGGNRSSALQAVSPDVRRLSDVYSGSMATADKNLRGASHDQAVAELIRQRAADTAALTGAPRMQAAATLLNEGRAGNEAAVGTASSQAGIYGNQAAGYGNQVQTLLQQQQTQAKQWSDMGAGLLKTLGPNWWQMLSGKGAVAGMSNASTASSGMNATMQSLLKPINFGSTR